MSRIFLSGAMAPVVPWVPPPASLMEPHPRPGREPSKGTRCTELRTGGGGEAGSSNTLTDWNKGVEGRSTTGTLPPVITGDTARGEGTQIEEQLREEDRTHHQDKEVTT